MQKIIVTDTTCIGYLIQINCLNILQIIYGEIIIPKAVYHEILPLENKGFDLTEFKKASWIKIYSANHLAKVEEFNHILDIEELEAISIALELNADLLIIDEKLGRIVATNIGFDITGLVGVFIAAKKMNLIISVKDALNKVILLGCRISKQLYNTALKSCNEL